MGGGWRGPNLMIVTDSLVISKGKEHVTYLSILLPLRERGSSDKSTLNIEFFTYCSFVSGIYPFAAVIYSG